MNSLRLLWAVALVEWKLQVRTVVFWTGLAILLLYALGQVIGIPSQIAFLSRQWLGGREGSLTWLSIVLIFLVPSSLARDRRTAAFVFTTPVTGSVYAGGKLTGIWLTALTLAGIELTTQFLIRAPAWERLTPEVVSMILTSLKGWLIGLFYIVTLYFLITALVKGQALLAYALNIVWFVAAFSVKDVANPFGFIISPAFRSDLIGDGPESLLINSHHMLYLGLTIVVAILALLVYPWRERRSLFRKAEKALLLFGLALAFSVAGWTGSIFARSRAQTLAITGLVPHSLSALSFEDVRSVRVTARFEPEQGHVEGSVELVFMQPLENVTLHIPSGLELSAVTDCQAQELQVTRLNEEWAQIASVAQVCVVFEGTWHVNRVAYQQYGNIGPEALDLNVGAYIGQGYVYLTPGARWYPAPVGPYEWATTHDIQIMVPHALPALVVPEASAISRSEWTSYEWPNHRGRPLIMLIAGAYGKVTLPSGDMVWASPEHQHVAPQAANFYLAFLKPIDQLVRHDALRYQVVETPVLRWPIASGQMVLLPERYFYERLSPALPTEYERNVSSLGPQRAFQQEAYRTVQGWLLGQVFCTDTSFIGDPVAVLNPSLDPYFGFVPLCESMAHYLSLQLLDHQFATRRLDEIMEARIRYSDDYLQSPELKQRGGGIEGELPTPPYERSWAFNQMFAAIGRLERHVGREQVNRMIGLLLERRYGGAITTADWLEIVSEIAGSEARQEFESTCIVQTSQLP
ncbi:MAG: hypothetical protein QXS54_05075 [Candidatus Methanomethylicaceae archaeon]